MIRPKNVFIPKNQLRNMHVTMSLKLISLKDVNENQIADL